ncbi:sensor histidine kinase [Amycolatopsis sp. NPDC098790]|uniref:sensor histidine kinase n=1 Tax=Amycolatopsis sp. NPDC098790 TaxID=3363939 RepID=UPI0038050825
MLTRLLRSGWIFRGPRRGAGAEPDEPGAPSREGAPAELVRAVHAAVCLGIGLLGALGPVRSNPSWPLAVTAAGCAVVLVAAHLIGIGYGRAGFRGAALALQAVLSVLPVFVLGPSWSVSSCFLAGSVLLVARPALSVPLLVAVAAGVGFVFARADEAAPLWAGVEGTALTAVAAVAVFGLAWFARLSAERADSTRELAARAVAEERMRFGRDTHDLLGLSLSAITLKVELVRRLVDDRPEQAHAELAELVTMSREALSDVRTIAAGQRELCLADECRAAAAVLRAAGVSARFDDRLADGLPTRVGTVLAAVLRESVTNVVRHSEAGWCEVSIREARGAAHLVITNDGVVPPRDGSGEAHGSGLRNLTHRVGALGGELTAGVRPDGTHALRASVPLEPPVTRRRRAG